MSDIVNDKVTMSLLIQMSAQSDSHMSAQSDFSDVRSIGLSESDGVALSPIIRTSGLSTAE